MGEHIPRADRPSRERALRALARYLETHRDIRIGQAIVAAAHPISPFYVEDDVLAEWLEFLAPADPVVPEPPAHDPLCGCQDCRDLRF